MNTKNKQTLENAYQSILNESINTNTVMTKVYIVFKKSHYSEAILLSVHATEKGAKDECERLHKRQLGKTDLNPYFYEEQEILP